MLITTEHIIRQVRQKVNQPADDPGIPFWSQRELCDNLNRELEEVWEELVKIDVGYFLPTTTIALTGAGRYELPYNVDEIRYVWLIPAGGASDTRARLPKIPRELLGRVDGYAIFFTDEVDDDELHRRVYIEITAGVDQSGYELEVLYATSPFEVTMGTCSSAAGASDEIILDDDEVTINDIYRNGRLYICRGAGAGQSRGVTGYTGHTLTGKLTSAWATEPDETSVYTSIIPLPYAATAVLVYGTAVRALSNEEVPKMGGMARLRENALMKLQYAAATANPQSPTHTKDTAGYLDIGDECGDYVMPLG